MPELVPWSILTTTDTSYDPFTVKFEDFVRFATRNYARNIGRAIQMGARIIPQAAVAAVISEAAVITAIDIYEKRGQIQDAAAMREALNADNLVIQQALGVLDTTATSGALSLTGEKTLEGAEQVAWDPTPVPVSRPVPIEEIVINTSRPVDNSVDIYIRPTIQPLPIPARPDIVIPGIGALPLPIPGEIPDILSGNPSLPLDVPVNHAGVLTIPQTVITVLTNDGVHVNVNVNTDITAAVIESATQRKDKKPSGLWYLAALRMVNRTFGTLTELDDLSLATQNNLKFTEDTEICVAPGQCIIVKAGQTLADIPLQYKGQVIAQMSEQGIPTSLDYEGFITDLFTMEITDTAIALASVTERALISQLGLRGPLDYGNISTWLNRMINSLPEN